MRFLSNTARGIILFVVVFLLLFGLFFAPDLVLVAHLERLTRADCLLHRPWLIVTYALADGVTFLSYMGISGLFAVVAYRSCRRPEHQQSITSWVLGWVSAFVFLCGVNHLFDTLTIQFSLYEEFAYVKALMAGVSVYTALFVVRHIEDVVILPRWLVRQRAEEMMKLLQQPAGTVQESVTALYNALDLISPGWREDESKK